MLVRRDELWLTNDGIQYLPYTPQMRTTRRVVSVSEDQILEDWGGGGG